MGFVTWSFTPPRTWSLKKLASYLRPPQTYTPFRKLHILPETPLLSAAAQHTPKRKLRPRPSPPSAWPRRTKGGAAHGIAGGLGGGSSSLGRCPHSGHTGAKGRAAWIRWTALLEVALGRESVGRSSACQCRAPLAPSILPGFAQDEGCTAERGAGQTPQGSQYCITDP